jgi:predicted MFS family arabinose efflux permease
MTVCGNRISIGVAIPALVSEFGMTNTEAGALSGFFFLGFFITQVPAGFWIARFGSRGLVGITLCLMSVFLWLFGSMTTLVWAGWYRLGLGLSQGPVSVGSNSIIGQWFPPKEQSRAISVLVASTMLAPVLFPPLSSWVIVELGWRALFQGFAVTGLLTAALWGLYIRSCPEENSRCSKEELHVIRSLEVLPPAVRYKELPRFISKILFMGKVVVVAGTKAELFKRPDLWWAMLSYFCFISLFQGITTWLPSYFVHVRGMDMIQMGWVVSVPWVGAFAGSLTGGWIVDHWLGGNPLPVMRWGSLFTAASLYLFFESTAGMGLTLCLLLLFGFFVGLTPSGFMTYPIRLASREVYPLGLSFMNSCANMGGFLSPVVAGMLLDHYGNYSAVFAYLIACGVMASVLSMLVRAPIEGPNRETEIGQDSM